METYNFMIHGLMALLLVLVITIFELIIPSLIISDIEYTVMLFGSWILLNQGKLNE